MKYYCFQEVDEDIGEILHYMGPAEARDLIEAYFLTDGPVQDENRKQYRDRYNKEFVKDYLLCTGDHPENDQITGDLDATIIQCLELFGFINCFIVESNEELSPFYIRKDDQWIPTEDPDTYIERYKENQ